MTDLSSSNREELPASHPWTLLERLVGDLEGDAISDSNACPSCTHPSCERRRAGLKESREALKQFVSRLQSENERLKETALTGQEVGMVIYALEKSVSLYPQMSPWPPIIEKLRRISDTGEK